MDVSFIEDCAQPAAFNLVNSMSPSKIEESKATVSETSPLSQEVVLEAEISEEAENHAEISEKLIVKVFKSPTKPLQRMKKCSNYSQFHTPLLQITPCNF